jgi:hypothetical protein
MSNYNSNTNFLNYRNNLRKQMKEELDLPDPKKLLDKQNELNEKELWIKVKLEEISEKEKELFEKDKKINELVKDIILKNLKKKVKKKDYYLLKKRII